MGGRVAVVVLVLAAWAGPAHAARIETTPRSSLVDAPVHVRVTGLRPGVAVTVEAREGVWLGRGVFRADAHGVVDLARDRSTGGTYRGRDAMGLFWSMWTTGGRGAGWPGGGGTISLRALVGGRSVATGSVERRLSSPEVTETATTLAADGFLGRYYAPPGGGPLTPVLLLGGSEGGYGGAVDGPLLASHGFAALSVAYFGEQGLPQDLVDIPLEYFATAIRWLDGRPGVDPSRLVVSGVSRGSEAALLLATDFPQLVHGVVALSLSTIVNAGLPTTRGSGPVAAWTLAGKPIAPGTAIPVSQISGPVFVAAGERDSLWNSYGAEQVVAVELRGRRDVVALAYPGAGHDVGFAVPNVPLGTIAYSRRGALDLGGSRPADARARADLWPRLLRFLAAV